jgi:hypothetical protein
MRRRRIVHTLIKLRSQPNRVQVHILNSQDRVGSYSHLHLIWWRVIWGNAKPTRCRVIDGAPLTNSSDTHSYSPLEFARFDYTNHARRSKGTFQSTFGPSRSRMESPGIQKLPRFNTNFYLKCAYHQTGLSCVSTAFKRVNWRVDIKSKGVLRLVVNEMAIQFIPSLVNQLDPNHPPLLNWKCRTVSLVASMTSSQVPEVPFIAPGTSQRSAPGTPPGSAIGSPASTIFWIVSGEFMYGLASVPDFAYSVACCSLVPESLSLETSISWLICALDFSSPLSASGDSALLVASPPSTTETLDVPVPSLALPAVSPPKSPQLIKLPALTTSNEPSGLPTFMSDSPSGSSALSGLSFVNTYGWSVSAKSGSMLRNSSLVGS